MKGLHSISFYLKLLAYSAQLELAILINSTSHATNISVQIRGDFNFSVWVTKIVFLRICHSDYWLGVLDKITISYLWHLSKYSMCLCTGSLTTSIYISITLQDNCLIPWDSSLIDLKANFCMPNHYKCIFQFWEKLSGSFCQMWFTDKWTKTSFVTEILFKLNGSKLVWL